MCCSALTQAEDLDALKAKVQALSTASMKIGETLSQQSGGGGGASGGELLDSPVGPCAVS